MIEPPLKSLGSLQFHRDAVRKALVDFVRREVDKAGFQKGVVGLSGGVDSAVVTALGAEALGPSNLLAVLMPYKTSSPDSVRDSQAVAAKLGIQSEFVDISPMVDAYLSRYPEMDNIRRGNVMARQRMIVLYDLSARENALVLGTSNKTERLLGYGTLYGDTACAINPLGNLYKTQVWQLAEALDIPREIIEKKPSADLWPGQTDEGELGFSYKLVDQLLFHMIDKQMEMDHLLKLGFEKELTIKVQTLVRRNEFKQRPSLIAELPHSMVNANTHRSGNQ